MTRFLLFVIAIFLPFACDNGAVLPDGSGRSGELLVVADPALWEGASGTAVRDLLASEQTGLPQSEPKFHLIHIAPRHLNATFKRMRNILILSIEPGEKPFSEINRNVWAEDQVCFTLKAPDDQTMAAFVKGSANWITDAFYQNDFRLIRESYKKHREPARETAIYKKHGFKMLLPSTFKIVKDTSDFIWLRQSFDKQENGEMHEVFKNIWVHQEPYLSTAQLGLDSMVARRNRITKEHIVGPLPDSYMQVVPEFPHEHRTYEIDGLYVAEIRGLWNMANARMGGPYVMLSTIHNDTLYSTDAFVFAPNINKRDYMRELEALISTIRFTGDGQK